MARTAGTGPPAAGSRRSGAPREPWPLLPAAARPLARVLAAGCAAGVAVLGAWFWHQARPGSLDRSVFGWLYAHHEVHRAVLIAVAQLGTAIPVTIMACALVVVSLAQRRWRGAALVAAAVPAAAALTELVLKPLVGRTIEGSLSFPSGHATAMFALATAAWILLLGPARPPGPAAARLALAAAALVVACTVTAATVVLTYHYFTDTVGGAAVGTGTVLATALALDHIAARRQRR